MRCPQEGSRSHLSVTREAVLLPLPLVSFCKEVGRVLENCELCCNSDGFEQILLPLHCKPGLPLTWVWGMAWEYALGKLVGAAG